jgi:epoxyqueuosine reductase QueG
MERTELMDTYSRIGSVAASSDCEFLGVADLTIAEQFIREQGGVTVADFPKAVSIGIALPNAIVDQLPDRADPAVATNYRSHAYEVINERLNSVASRVAGVLQVQGYRALPIPASASIDEEGLSGVFSHKLAAHLAGLGWIGKCCLLVTPQVGPRVRWISVLTDAPLPATGGPTEEKCKSCTECIDICPVQAFTGRSFRAEEPRSARYDAAKCSEYYGELANDAGSGVCGLCLYACPFGEKPAESPWGIAALYKEV